MKMRVFNKIILLSLLWLSACGYQLTRHTELPKQFNNVYISSTLAYSPNTVLLTKTLKNANINVVDDIKDAEYTFKILGQHENNNAEGSSSTLSTRKYTLRSSLTFSVVDNNGHKIYGPKSVSSTEPLYIYSGQVLGNNQQTNTIFNNLRKENMTKVLAMLSSQSSHTAFDNSNSSS